MASTDHTIRVPMPPMKFTVKFPRAARLRIAIAFLIMRLAAWVMPCEVELDLIADKDSTPE